MLSSCYTHQVALIYRTVTTTTDCFLYEVIDLSSVCFREHLADVGEGVLELVEVMAVGLITCGEVEDVVGASPPVGSGVAQVFHDLLVELRLLLVAEVEEGEEEEGQEES